MRIIFLNTWNGRVWNKLRDFIVDESKMTDIFCFQEVGGPLFNKISEILTDYKGWKISKPYINSWVFDQVIFSKKPETVCQEKDFLKVGSGLSAEVQEDDKKVVICNIHGVSIPGNKFDSEERLLQSKQILDFTKTYNFPVVIGGDFNLMPETESIKMFEKAGYRNLIKDFEVKNTRNSMGWEFYKKVAGFVKQYYADYVFTSPEVKVKNFEVPEVEISDHLPLILDFSLDSARD